MNNPPSSIKSYIILAIIVIVAAAGYFYWKGSAGTDSGALGVTDASDSSAGEYVFNLLAQISALKIDASFFTDPVYQTLRDYTVNIPSLPVGRPNPFAPVPGMPTTPTNR